MKHVLEQGSCDEPIRATAETASRPTSVRHYLDGFSWPCWLTHARICRVPSQARGEGEAHALASPRQQYPSLSHMSGPSVACLALGHALRAVSGALADGGHRMYPRHRRRLKSGDMLL
jgi:hypothetical protein